MIVAIPWTAMMVAKQLLMKLILLVLLNKVLNSRRHLDVICIKFLDHHRNLNAFITIHL